MTVLSVTVITQPASTLYDTVPLIAGYGKVHHHCGKHSVISVTSGRLSFLAGCDTFCCGSVGHSVTDGDYDNLSWQCGQCYY